jgi:hypothetical protein
MNRLYKDKDGCWGIKYHYPALAIQYLYGKKAEVETQLATRDKEVALLYGKIAALEQSTLEAKLAGIEELIGTVGARLRKSDAKEADDE